NPREQGKRFAALESYDYPGFFTDDSAGKQHVQVQLQAHQAGARIVEGRSDSPRLAVARRFTLNDHPRRDFNADYNLVRVNLQGRQPQSLEEGASAEGSSFTLEFAALPASTPCRPPQRFPRPRVEGVQTAFVTGP